MNILSYSMAFIKKAKSMRPPPLMYSWEIYEFFKITEEAARSPADLLKRDSNRGIFL